MNNDLLNKVKLATKVVYSFESKKNIDALLKHYSFDICHCHNIYHAYFPVDSFKNKKERDSCGNDIA